MVSKKKDSGRVNRDTSRKNSQKINWVKVVLLLAVIVLGVTVYRMMMI